WPLSVGAGLVKQGEVNRQSRKQQRKLVKDKGNPPLHWGHDQRYPPSGLNVDISALWTLGWLRLSSADRCHPISIPPARPGGVLLIHLPALSLPSKDIRSLCNPSLLNEGDCCCKTNRCV